MKVPPIIHKTVELPQVALKTVRVPPIIHKTVEMPSIVRKPVELVQQRTVEYVGDVPVTVTKEEVVHDPMVMQQVLETKLEVGADV